MKGASCETRPAGATGDKSNVEKKENGKEVLSDGYGNRCTNKPPFELLGNTCK